MYPGSKTSATYYEMHQEMERVNHVYTSRVCVCVSGGVILNSIHLQSSLFGTSNLLVHLADVKLL